MYVPAAISPQPPRNLPPRVRPSVHEVVGREALEEPRLDPRAFAGRADVDAARVAGHAAALANLRLRGVLGEDVLEELDRLHARAPVLHLYHIGRLGVRRAA